MNDSAVHCDAINECWIAKFRKWLVEQPIKGTARPLAPATIENSVLQLAAAIRWAKQMPRFKSIPLPEVTNSPTFRANVPQLAAMFAYAFESDRRANLLAFLRISVATWCRPDAALDASTAKARGQWLPAARAFNLNPVGRRQTRKRRALMPIPECVGAWLDTIKGPIMSHHLSKATWRRMEKELGLPMHGESGMKLIRR